MPSLEHTYFTKHYGRWVIRRSVFRPGQLVHVTKRSGAVETVRVDTILEVTNGMTIASFTRVRPGYREGCAGCEASRGCRRHWV